MKKILLILLLLCNGFLLAQDDNAPIFLNNEPTYRKAPVYKGCETLFNNKEFKDCMSEKISELFSENFNSLSFIFYKLRFPFSVSGGRTFLFIK